MWTKDFFRGVAATIISASLIFSGWTLARGQSAANQGLASYITGVDPCTASSNAKSSAFANITTATTTQIIALTAGKAIYVCGLAMDISSSTASTAIFEYGTGASCGTGTTVLSHTFTNSTAVNAYKFYGSGEMTVLTAPAGNALCVLSTVGTSPTIGVTVTFVQM